MDSVECFRHVKGYCYGALPWLLLVESSCCYVVDLVKCCGGRSVLSKSVLVLGEVDVGGDGEQDDFFKRVC